MDIKTLRELIQYDPTPVPQFGKYFNTKLNVESELDRLANEETINNAYHEIIEFFYFVGQVYNFNPQIMIKDFEKIMTVKMKKSLAFNNGDMELKNKLLIKEKQVIEAFHTKYKQKLGIDLQRAYQPHEMHRAIELNATRTKFMRNFFMVEIVKSMKIIQTDQKMKKLFVESLTERGVSTETFDSWLSAFINTNNDDKSIEKIKANYIPAYKALGKEFVLFNEERQSFKKSYMANYHRLFRNKVEDTFNLDKVEFIEDVMFIKACMSVALRKYLTQTK
ncbi:hypothetical protein Q6U52_000871 [Vibrio alginolyticus]|nr:hypothetical protein [Vibrio alginolyticus]